MAITTYQGLRAAICDTVNNDAISSAVTAFESISIDSTVKRAVEKATMRIQRDLISRGGHKNMEAVNTSLTTTNGVEYLDFPSDFAGARVFQLSTNPLVNLAFADPNSLWLEYPTPVTGKPVKYTIIGLQRAYMRPIPDSTYATRLVYYQQLTALSADSDSNWVLTYHWDIYEAAAMLELCLALETDERLQYWNGIYNQKMNDLMGDDRNVRWAAVPQTPTVQMAIA